MPPPSLGGGDAVGAGGAGTGIGAAAIGRVMPGWGGVGMPTGACGTAPEMRPAGGRLPVAGGGSGGSSSRAWDPAPRGPSATPRGSIAWSTRSPSITAPARNARGGLPSTEINAIPGPPAARGATTPIKRNRLLTSGTGASAAATGTGSAPNSRVRSPRGRLTPLTGTVCAGATGDTLPRRKAQNTAVAARTAHTKNADKRAVIRRL